MKIRTERLRRARDLFVTAVMWPRVGGKLPDLEADLEEDRVLRAVVGAYALAVHEGRAATLEEACVLLDLRPALAPGSVLGRRARRCWEALSAGAEREAIRALRRLGGSWEQVFDLLAEEEDRILHSGDEGSDRRTTCP